MPERAIKSRGGAIRYRTIKVGGKTLKIAVVRKAGKRGGIPSRGKQESHEQANA